MAEKQHKQEQWENGPQWGVDPYSPPEKEGRGGEAEFTKSLRTLTNKGTGTVQITTQ